MDNFWSNAKAARIKLGLTQKEIADKLAVSLGGQWEQNKYAFYEGGRAKKTTNELKEVVAVILGVPVDELEGATDVVIAKFPIEIQKWIATAESNKYILRAYAEWLGDQMEKPSK